VEALFIAAHHDPFMCHSFDCGLSLVPADANKGPLAASKRPAAAHNHKVATVHDQTRRNITTRCLRFWGLFERYDHTILMRSKSRPEAALRGHGATGNTSLDRAGGRMEQKS
jgi:hypothetical protein